MYETVTPASRLCWPCYSGDHSKRHGQIGCLQGIGWREDVICRCDVPGEYQPGKAQTVFSNSRRNMTRYSTG